MFRKLLQAITFLLYVDKVYTTTYNKVITKVIKKYINHRIKFYDAKSLCPCVALQGVLHKLFF